MSKIKSNDTTPEQILGKKLWSLGLRYRKNFKSLPGKPDIVITRGKLAIFVDGEFWHGYQWRSKKKRLKSNRKYWVRKIEGNILRDRKYRNTLRKLGWKVIRFWEHQIKNDLDECVDVVLQNLLSELPSNAEHIKPK